MAPMEQSSGSDPRGIDFETRDGCRERGRLCRRTALLLAVLFVLPALLTTPAPAAAQAPSGESRPELVKLDPRLFPVPDELRPNVAFWTDIFSRYTSDQVVIHDEWRPDRIFAVVDFSALADAPISEAERRKRKTRAVNDEMAKIQGVLEDLGHGRTPSDAELAAEIRRMFANQPRQAYLDAAGHLRKQTGVADHYRAALGRSGRYLPYMEEIFKREGLPIELTRLPFVESMFQKTAKSKVAAGGIWQIMPATGRPVMRVESDLDERYDPYLATEAAAGFLKKNYQSLGHWPLAITAYNYGTNGMIRAQRQWGNDLGTIVRNHQTRTFGFASRNFYSEFVAAAQIYANREHYFPGVGSEPRQRFDEVFLSHYVPLDELVAGAGADLDDLEYLNPALSSQVVSGRLFVPSGYRLRVPAGQGDRFRAAYEALPDGRKLGRQVGTYHRVRQGETLSTIARRYGVSVGALQQENRLGRSTLIRIGQRLEIPHVRHVRATPAPPRPQPTVHVVQRGETLSAIARRYGTTVRSLMALNRISNAGLIRPGQRLTVSR